MLFLVVALVIGGLILITLVQAARADTILDRLLNIALAAANSLVLLVLIGFVFERPAFFGDVGLAYALLAFLFPLAFAKYLESEGGTLADWRNNRPRRADEGPDPDDVGTPDADGPDAAEASSGEAPS
jgi:multicomponent Na+:H+ antiporter subunit F